MRSGARISVWVVVSVSGLLTAFVTASPTGTGWLDVGLLVAFGAGVAVAAAYAPAWIVVGVSVAALGLSLFESDAVVIGVLAVASVVADVAGRRPRRVRRPIKAGAGLLLAQGLLRLEGGAFTGDTALVTGLLVAALGLATFARLRRHQRRMVAVSALIVLGLTGVAAGATGLAVNSARGNVDGAVDAIEEGLDALRSANQEEAVEHFRAAAVRFADARGSLRQPWARGGRAVPAVAQNYDAVDTLTGIGEELARVAAETTASADLDSARLEDGTIDLAAIAALEAPLERSLGALRGAQQRTLEIEPTWLLSPLAEARLDLVERLSDAVPDAQNALAAARVAPGLFGGDEPRHYFVAVTTPAEARASGGFMGNFAELEASGGAMRMTDFGRVHELNEAGDRESRELVGAPDDYVARYGDLRIPEFWQDVTFSPDFPSVARVIEGLYPQSGGRQLDGVISIDPYGLAALLELTGPVEIAQREEPVTSENAADLLLRDQYVEFEGDQAERVDFLEATAFAVFDELTSGSLPGPGRIAEVLGPAVREGRIKLHSVHQAEQGFFQRVGLAGAYPPVRGHFVGVTNQNGSSSKIDAFLHRELRYEAAVNPASGRTDALVEVTLRNDAPPSGLPTYVLGGNVAPEGVNRTYLSVYSPLEFVGARLGDQELEMDEETELGRQVYSAYVDVPPQSSVTVRVRLTGRLPARVEGDTASVRVDVARQALVHPDEVEIDLRFPDEWRVRGGEGSRFTSRFTLEEHATRVVEVERES